MNRVFDYNGTLVAPSKPVKTLRTVKKTFLIDSSDRDTTKYYTNGDVVYYLPRVYENVVTIRLKSATFPRMIDVTSAGSVTHSYSDGQNIPSAKYSTDTKTPNTIRYFLIDIEGLNKNDETAVAANRSTFPDSFFARIPVVTSNTTDTIYYVEYSDNNQEHNISKYTPPISKLDRMRIRMRTHAQQGNQGFLYWTTDGEVATGSNQGAGSDYSLVFEIEMLDNTFDDFSSFETRLSDRDVGSGFSRNY